MNNPPIAEVKFENLKFLSRNGQLLKFKWLMFKTAEIHFLMNGVNCSNDAEHLTFDYVSAGQLSYY